MKLTNPTDEELNAAFAERVAGWHRWRGAGGVPLNSWHDADRDRGKAKFTTSFDAVFPWLEKGSAHFSRNYFMAGGGRENLWCLHFLWWDESEKRSKEGKADDKSLPRAAVIALLRAHGMEVEFP